MCMSMDAAPSGRSFIVMDDILCHYGDHHERRWLDWEVVQCKKRNAIGCGPDGQCILDGIELLVLRGDDDYPQLYPAMSIRLTNDDVLSRVGSMIDQGTADIWGRDMISISCRVCAVEGDDIMVIRLAFTTPQVIGSFQAYYLVYNSANRSLWMIPVQDPRFGTSCPLPLRSDEDGGYSLVVLASRLNRAVCLWSLPALSDISSHKGMDHQWVVKDRDCCVNVDHFDAHVAFSCNGNAVWGDLTQGVMYCSYIDLLRGGDQVNFEYISLPKKHRISHREAIMMGDSHVLRNMSLIGNSIWFVAITPSDTSDDTPDDTIDDTPDDTIDDTMVDVWTLDLTQHTKEPKEWKIYMDFRMQSILELDADIGNRLLPMSLHCRFPILRQEEDAGILLYMLLPFPSGRKGHFVGIDVGSKDPKIVSSRRLAVPWMRRPVLLPIDFFKPCDVVD